MKTLSPLILLLAVLCGCATAHAEPPDHKPLRLTVVAPAGVPITGVIAYGANHSDMQWTRITYMATTNGQYMATQVPSYEIYTATSTNALTGQESDYAPKVSPDTNGVLVIPALIITK